MGNQHKLNPMEKGKGDAIKINHDCLNRLGSKTSLLGLISL